MLEWKDLVKKLITIFFGRCSTCKFYKDDRKCPMADEDAMSGNNFCYNYFKK